VGNVISRKLVRRFFGVFEVFSKKKLDRDELKFKKINKQLEMLKKEKKEKLEEDHQLKFGGYIDLQSLDAVQETKEEIEAKKLLLEEEKKSSKAIEKIEKELLRSKKELTAKKTENTRIIEEITELGNKSLDLRKDLDSSNKSVFKEKNEEKRTNLSKDKRNLKELVGFFEQEIENLRYEIGLFKRKGGHLYT